MSDPLHPSHILRLGTRTSQLALWQTNHVATLLQRAFPHLQCELVHLVTQGDKRLDRPLPEIGGKGLFTAELEEALRRGEIDLAVHSLKDLPVENPADLIIGAILSREDTRDVLVARSGWTLATLPQGAVVGTSSLRRQAQLLALHPDLQVRSIRGNVDTRLRKVLSGEYDAAVMAGAGLSRLGLEAHITEWLSPEVMLCAPGQGALAVQCRKDDRQVPTLLAAIHDPVAAATTEAERQLLFHLGGGCSAPVGAWAQQIGNELELRARVVSIDGRHTFDSVTRGVDPHHIAQEAADDLHGQGAHIVLRQQRSGELSPLAGLRVVVTRPRQSDDALIDGLQQVGAVPILLPATEVVAILNSAEMDTARANLSVYDWIIFTSKNGVISFATRILPQRLEEILANTHVAAVGPATSEALSNFGVPVHALPAEFVSTKIVGILGNLEGKRVLLPRSAKGTPDLPVALRAAGATVDEIALYAPVNLPLDEEAYQQLLSGVDAVTFASGSAVRAFVEALDGDVRFATFWETVAVACIGPTTAEVARVEGLPVHVVATQHDAPGLVAALTAFYANVQPLKEPRNG